MKNYTKALSLLILLLIVVQVFSVNAFAFSPIEIDGIYQSAPRYDSADDVNYVKDGKYIYNWGIREEEATFLTTYAEGFYTGNNTYDVLSGLAGGTTDKDAPNSALYKALSSLMSSKHSYETSYNATRPLFKYTDCENGGGKISSFYSGDPVGPSWDSGNTWNREHCWPNSKGNASGNGENDIMMLRPASVSENSSRGNKAYGQSSGYYNPNSESGGEHDLRGDVARIVLYTYVRWKCTNTGSSYNPNGITGTGGVIESIDLLLMWIEEDPVDTWELGRNDAVQAITGTRNVFVDYPEFAFLLFSEEIPEMATPSGEAQNGACHWDEGTVTKQPTCTSEGTTTYKCTDSGCGKTKTVTIAELGHSMDGGKVTVAATCTTTGTTTFSCTRCTYTKTETVKALGHDWGNWEIVEAPTCSAEGTQERVCKHDSSHIDISQADKLPHSFGDWITDKEPTETEDGKKHRVCSDCGTRENGIIPSITHEHSYKATVIDPTCTEQGYTLHSCLCGDSYKDTYKNKLGHTFVNGNCSVCGAVDAKNAFITAVDSLSNLSGESLYNGICEALRVYGNLSDESKAEVADKYAELKKIATDYNNDVAATNSYADLMSSRVVGIAVTLSSLALALSCVFGKKYI